MVRFLPLLTLSLILAAGAAGAPEDLRDQLPEWKIYVWDELSLLMGPEEKASFAQLPDMEALDEWLRLFWLRRDPTPTTPENERRQDHEARLTTALALYPSKDPPGFDLRGRDLILFGPPDERILQDDWFDETGYHPLRETWVWAEAEMRATYEDRNLDGAYELAMDLMPSSRGDVQRRYSSMFGEDNDEAALFLRDLKSVNPQLYQELIAKLAEGEINNLMELKNQATLGELLGPKLERMKGTYLDAVKAGEVHFRHDFGAEGLWAVFSVDCFRGENGLSRVELSHQVRARDLRFQWMPGAGRYEARLHRRVVFYDELERAAAQEESSLLFTATNLDQTRSAALLPSLVALQLPEGAYRMALRLEDEEGGRLQVFTTPVSVRGFPADSLRVSDLTFAAYLGEAASPGPFSKGEWQVTPHPYHAYGRDDAVKFYFEVYGLERDERGLSDYSVSYRIRRQQPEIRSSWLWTREEEVNPAVSATFLDSQGEPVARHPLSVSAAGFDPEAYFLEVKVTDRLSGRSARAGGRFSVVPAGSLR